MAAGHRSESDFRKPASILPAAFRSTPVIILATPIALAGGIVSVQRPDFLIAFAGEPALIATGWLSILALAMIVLSLTLRRSAHQAPATGLEEIIELLPVGAGLWRKDGTLEHCNSVLRQQCGGDKSGLPAGSTPGLQSCSPFLNKGSEFEAELGNGICLHVTALQLSDGRRLSVAKDISDHRLTKRRLAKSLRENSILMLKYQEQAIRAEEASRAKSAFLAHLSHDIRTPLNHIIGFAELIRQEAFGQLGNPRYYAYLDDIKSSGEWLRDSFAEVLELAELDAGRRELKAEPIPTATLFERLIDRFGATANRAAIDLQFVSAPDGAVLGDLNSLDRMFGNLIDNALRFTPRGGTVRITAWESGDTAVIEVTDTGVGISAERVEALGTPFNLGDAAFAREHGGLGLGLAISRAIAEQSGGSLAVDSTPPLGTTVAVSLPRAVAEAKSGSRAA